MIIKPEGWQCTFKECPAGFFVFGGSLCLKSEYFSTGGGQDYNDAYCESGEYFYGGVDNNEDRDKLMVQPVIVGWEEFEE